MASTRRRRPQSTKVQEANYDSIGEEKKAEIDRIRRSKTIKEYVVESHLKDDGSSLTDDSGDDLSVCEEEVEAETSLPHNPPHAKAYSKIGLANMHRETEPSHHHSYLLKDPWLRRIKSFNNLSSTTAEPVDIESGEKNSDTDSIAECELYFLSTSQRISMNQTLR
jgi:hypothetical protein